MWTREAFLGASLDFQCFRAGHSRVGPDYSEPWTQPSYSSVSAIKEGGFAREFRGPDERCQTRPGDVHYNYIGRWRRSAVASPGGARCGWAHFKFVFLGGHDFLGFFDTPLVFRGRVAETLAEIQERLAELCAEGAPTGFLELAALKVQGGRLLEALLSESRLRDGAGAVAEDLQLLEGTLRFLRERFHEPLELGALARRSGMSRTRFHERFQRALGMAPMQYVRHLRVEKAKELLLTTALPVGEVAAAVGYDDPFHFSRVFRGLAGNSPTDYRGRRNGVS